MIDLRITSDEVNIVYVFVVVVAFCFLFFFSFFWNISASKLKDFGYHSVWVCLCFDSEYTFKRWKSNWKKKQKKKQAFIYYWKQNVPIK